MTPKILRPTPALRVAVAHYLEPIAADHPCVATVRAMRRTSLIKRARIVAPSLRRVDDDEVIARAVAVCS